MGVPDWELRCRRWDGEDIVVYCGGVVLVWVLRGKYVLAGQVMKVNASWEKEGAESRLFTRWSFVFGTRKVLALAPV